MPKTFYLNMPLALTLNAAFRSTATRLSPIAGECAHYEASLILQHVLKLNRSALVLRGQEALSAAQYAEI